jgi:hypothetical protein
MKPYDVYQHPTKGYQAVKERFFLARILFRLDVVPHQRTIRLGAGGSRGEPPIIAGD